MMTVLPVTKTLAQLSPGPLARPHAFLDGVEYCNKCHDRDADQMRAKCLDCHSEMRTRTDARDGLHAQAEFRECRNCHVEHQGRDFELVFWKGGEQSFDHTLAGYTLRGKHAQATCRKCHKPEFISNPEALRARQKDLSYTFLGLDTACATCHHDEHRGQLATTCQQCHTFDAWAPAPGFDHGRTKFVLTGRHVTTACAKCHVKVSDPGAADPEYLRFANVRHDNCIDCHKDAHGGRLSSRCENCHTSNGWQVAATAGFDHNKTRYPLEGRHKTVTCEKCHPAGRAKTGLKSKECRDCHQDRHNGEFADRAQGGACEECHTVAGYTPSLFGIEQHQSTKFVVRAAHLAVPCVSCHGETKGTLDGRKGRYTWTSSRCQDCHKDVHQGQLAKFVTESGCEGCHSDVTWLTVRYDHARANFPLAGKHASTACASCHRGDTTAAGIERLKFTTLSRDCESCHRDIHRGQFAVSDTLPQIRCERCHQPENWRASLFDHNSMTEYRLDGAHSKVSCAGCHKATQTAEIVFVDYQIPNRACRDCHAEGGAKAKGATP